MNLSVLSTLKVILVFCEFGIFSRLDSHVQIKVHCDAHEIVRAAAQWARGPVSQRSNTLGRALGIPSTFCLNRAFYTTDGLLCEVGIH